MLPLSGLTDEIIERGEDVIERCEGEADGSRYAYHHYCEVARLFASRPRDLTQFRHDVTDVASKPAASAGIVAYASRCGTRTACAWACFGPIRCCRYCGLFAANHSHLNYLLLCDYAAPLINLLARAERLELPTGRFGDGCSAN